MDKYNLSPEDFSGADGEYLEQYQDEFNTEYDRSNIRHITISSGRTRSAFCSRLENRVFMRTGKRNLSDSIVEKLCRRIHFEICCLRYGGELTG